MSLFIGNISQRALIEDLEEMFGKYGKCRINFKKNFAFAEFDEEKEAEEAMENLQGKELLGRQLNVEWSKNSKRYTGSSRHRRRSGSFSGKCYNCGHHGHYARDCPKQRRSRSNSRRSRRRSSEYSRRRRRRSRSRSRDSYSSSSSSDSRDKRRRYRRSSRDDRRHSRRSKSRDRRRSRSKSRSYSRKDSVDSRKDSVDSRKEKNSIEVKKSEEKVDIKKSEEKSGSQKKSMEKQD
ncbi:MAG: hypothetical protein MJ252_13935 [archaeon]|nr:hypothetical protein [archaeon]